MAGLLGGASGAAGAGAMGAEAGAAGAASAAAPAAAGAGTYGVMASNAAPAVYSVPTAPANYVMQSSGAGPYQLPQATGGMAGEGGKFPDTGFMAKLMEYAKRNPPNNPDRSQPSGHDAGQAPPLQYSHLLGVSGQYPTLSALMGAQLPTLQTGR